MIKKPMLACEYDPSKAKFPYMATPKIDGIRCVISGGKPLSRSLKPIRNKFIAAALSNLPDGFDGELTVGSNFQDSTSGVMSIDGEPDFTYWVFDFVDNPSTSYKNRIEMLRQHASVASLPSQVKVLLPQYIHTQTDLDNYLTLSLNQGHEGVILRSPDSPYKFGRSTAKENYLLKLKLFQDSEAAITGFQEKFTNCNAQQTNALGYSERSGHKENLVAAGTLGSILVKDLKTGVDFKIGSGFDDELRQLIWDNRSSYVGSMIKYKYMPHGGKDKPRHPIFLGFRSPEDL